MGYGALRVQFGSRCFRSYSIKINTSNSSCLVIRVGELPSSFESESRRSDDRRPEIDWRIAIRGQISLLTVTLLVIGYSLSICISVLFFFLLTTVFAWLGRFTKTHFLRRKPWPFSPAPVNARLIRPDGFGAEAERQKKNNEPLDKYCGAGQLSPSSSWESPSGYSAVAATDVA